MAENKKHTYIIDLFAATRYIIKADSEEKAVNQAYEWFEQYIPNCTIEVDDDEEDFYEI